MTAINFPSNPSNNDPYSENGIDWIYNSTKEAWFVVDHTEEKYVNVTGDNMTGDLTLGTDKITLKTDGSSHFNGQVNGNPIGAHGSGYWVFNKNACLTVQRNIPTASLNDSTYGFRTQHRDTDTDVVNDTCHINTDGTIRIGGVIPDAPNITLHEDGSIVAGIDKIRLNSNRMFFGSYGGGAGTTGGAGVRQVYTDTSTIFSWSKSESPNNAMLYLGSGPNPASAATTKFIVNNQGDVKIGQSILSNSGNGANISLNADGKSSFSNTLSVGKFNTSSNTVEGIDLNSYGRIRLQRELVNATGTIVDLRHGTLRSVKWTAEGKLYMGGGVDDTDLAGTTNILLDATDGSAMFKGSVQTAGGVVSPSMVLQLEADDDTKYISTTNEDGEETLVYNGTTLDVKDRLTKLDTALTSLKSAAASATDFASLQSAITTALSGI